MLQIFFKCDPDCLSEGSLTDSLGTLGSIFEDGCKKHENKEANKILSGLSLETSSEVCICTGNLCNSAQTSGINVLMALSCFALTIFRFIY